MLFRRNRPKRDTLSFNTTGWVLSQESAEHRAWMTPQNDAVVCRLCKLKPPIPFDPANPALLSDYYEQQSREHGGAMISVDISTCRGLEYLRGVFKYRSPQPGSLALYYVGIIVFPFKQCSYQINTESLEVGMTGMREAAVMAIGDGPPIREQPPQLMDGGGEPYADLRSLPLQRIPADAPKYDAKFPNHPLSKVRRLQTHILSTLSFPDRLLSWPKHR